MCCPLVVIIDYLKQAIAYSIETAELVFLRSSVGTAKSQDQCPRDLT